MAEFKHIGGDKVKPGNYWNFSTGERITLSNGGVLPGDTAATYYRAHPLFILLTGPLLGLVYAGFLPFIGIAVMIRMIGKMMVTKALGKVVQEGAKAAHFGWRPSEAYLAGKKHKKTEGKAMQENEDTAESK